jgi:hypothetical protein
MAKDYSEKQFKERLEKHGFTESGFGAFTGIYFKHKDFPNIRIPGIIYGYKLHYRETLAKLLRELKKMRDTEAK